jgi:hypothetical protein
MRTISFAALFVFVTSLAMVGCGSGSGSEEGSGTVQSGTYQGTIQEVNANEREIYVETGDGKTLELYFTDQTTLQQNGTSADFSALAKGQPVEVTVENQDGELAPVSVTITGSGDGGGDSGNTGESGGNTDGE